MSESESAIAMSAKLQQLEQELAKVSKYTVWIKLQLDQINQSQSSQTLPQLEQQIIALNSRVDQLLPQINQNDSQNGLKQDFIA